MWRWLRFLTTGASFACHVSKQKTDMSFIEWIKKIDWFHFHLFRNSKAAFIESKRKFKRINLIGSFWYGNISLLLYYHWLNPSHEMEFSIGFDYILLSKASTLYEWNENGSSCSGKMWLDHAKPHRNYHAIDLEPCFRFDLASNAILASKLSEANAFTLNEANSKCPNVSNELCVSSVRRIHLMVVSESRSHNYCTVHIENGFIPFDFGNGNKNSDMRWTSW